MARKLTAKQLAFVDAMISGQNQSEAYRTAYDVGAMSAKDIAREGWKLSIHPAMTPLINAGRAKITAKAITYGLTEAMAQAVEAYGVAKERGNAGAMVQAATLCARLNGLMVADRSNDRRPYADMTDAELQKIIDRHTPAAEHNTIQ